MKLSKTQHLIVAGVALTMTAAVLLQAVKTYTSDMQYKREHAALNAEVYAAELDKDFERGVSITESLEAMIVNSHGVVEDFDQTAALFMEDYIGSIQLAPDGVVTEIFPLEGNEAGLGDIVHDERRGPIVQYGIEHNLITMQGPFDL